MRHQLAYVLSLSISSIFLSMAEPAQGQVAVPVMQGVLAVEPDYATLATSDYPTVLAGFSSFVQSAVNEPSNPPMTSLIGMILAEQFNCGLVSESPLASLITESDALAAIDTITGYTTSPLAEFPPIDSCAMASSINPNDPSAGRPVPVQNCWNVVEEEARSGGQQGCTCYTTIGIFGFCLPDLPTTTVTIDPGGLYEEDPSIEEPETGGSPPGGSEGGDPPGGGGGGGGASPESLEGLPVQTSRDRTELYTRGARARTITSTLATDGYRLAKGEDIRIALPGRDYVLNRTYEAGTMFAYDSERLPWLIGRGWLTNAQSWVVQDPNTPQVTIYNVPAGTRGSYWPAVLENSTLVEEGETKTYPVFRPLGTGNGSIQIAHVTYDGGDGQVSVRAWVYSKPGQLTRAYYAPSDNNPTESPLDESLDGYLLFEEDVFGTRWTYTYDLISLAGSLESSPRLNTIYLGGTTEIDSMAWVVFDWDVSQSGGVSGTGRMRGARAYRRAQSGGNVVPILTQEVEYTYFSDVTNPAMSLISAPRPGTERPGANNNLVQVERRSRLNLPAIGQDIDETGTADWFSTIQQFRYSEYLIGRLLRPQDGVAIPMYAEVMTHEIGPDQIEWFAEHWDSIDCEGTPQRLPLAAQFLLEQELTDFIGPSDDGSHSEPPLPIVAGAVASGNDLYVDDLVSQRTHYFGDNEEPHSGRVKTQWIADGPEPGFNRKLDYAYHRQFIPNWVPYSDPAWTLLNTSQRPRRFVTRIREWTDDGSSGWTHQKTTFHWAQDVIVQEQLIELPLGDLPYLYRTRKRVTIATGIAEPGWEAQANGTDPITKRIWVTYNKYRNDFPAVSINATTGLIEGIDDPYGRIFGNGQHLQLFHPSAIADVKVEIIPDGIYVSEVPVNNLAADGMPDIPPLLDYGTGTPSADNAFTFIENGRAEEWTYDSLNRLLTSAEVRVGGGVGTPNLDSLQQIESKEYLVPEVDRITEAWPTGRIDLIKKADFYPDSMDLSRVESTEYQYWFGPKTLNGIGFEPVLARETISLRETWDQNGPGGQVSTTTRLDPHGRVEWRRAPDGSLTTYRYDSTIDSAIATIRNASPAGLSDSPVDPGSSRNSDGGSLSSITVFDVDGHIVAYADEQGVSGMYAYGNSAFQEHSASSLSNLTYLTQYTFPHFWDDEGVRSYSGAASVEWMHSGGQPLKLSGYLPDLPASATSVLTDWAGTGIDATVLKYGPLQTALTTESWFDEIGWFGDEVSRATQSVGINVHVQGNRVWHDLHNDVAADSDPSSWYETSFTYDVLGRSDSVFFPDDSIERTNGYDILDRPLMVEQAMVSDPFEPIVEYFYDGGDQPVQGVGEGQVTWLKTFTGGPNGEARNSRYVYDWRQRLRAIAAPIETGVPFTEGKAPHLIYFYDNLGRTVEASSVSSLTSGHLGQLRSDSATDTWALLPVGSGVDIASLGRSSFGARGLGYRDETALDPTDPQTGFLVSNAWYDEVGRTLAIVRPGGAVSKLAYDGLGRPTRQVVTDGASARPPAAFASTTTPGLFSDITNLDHPGDTVFSEIRNHYRDSNHGPNARGLLGMIETWRRPHDFTGTTLADSMGDPHAQVIRTFAATVYDPAARPIAGIDYGTNIATGSANDSVFAMGGQLPAMPEPDTVPDRATTPDRITETAYDAQGRPFEVTDAEDVVSRTIYDDLSRVIATVANRVSTGIGVQWNNDRWAVTGRAAQAPPNDGDRVTSLVYDSMDNVVQRVAHSFAPNSTTDEIQITEYVYSHLVALSGNTSNIYGQLYQIRYPDDSSGIPSSPPAPADTVTFAYNRLGEQIKLEDQNGTIRSFARDDHGQISREQVDTFGSSSVDDTVLALTTERDNLGRTTAVKSLGLNDAVLNQIEYVYEPWGAVKFQRQTSQQGGAVRELEFGFDRRAYGVANGNNSRRKWMRYPDGSRLFNIYGPWNASGAAPVEIDDDPGSRINRIHQLRLSGPTGTETDQFNTSEPMAIYEHLGADTVATTELGSIGALSDRTLAADDTRTSGVYPGWDRFGRLQRLSWVTFDYPDVGGAGFARKYLVESYTHDRVSNRLTKDDTTQDEGVNWRDHLDRTYTYDRLHRLTGVSRGSITDITTDPPAITAPQDDLSTQSWELDHLGNWDKVSRVDSVSGQPVAAPDETRDHSRTNELESITVNGVTESRAYDANGNLTGVGSSLDYEYDAWNRLVRVKKTGTTVAEYGYAPTHWQVHRRVDPSGTGSFTESREMIYSALWQLLEERIDSGDDGTTDRIEQQVWGKRHVDDAVSRRLDNLADGTYERSFTYVTDALFSVAALLDDAGSVHERVYYSEYGQPEFHAPENLAPPYQDWDFSDATEMNVAVGQATDPNNPVYPGAKYDLAPPYGTVDFSDMLAFLAAFDTKRHDLVAGQNEISDVSPNGPRNRIGYAGYVWDPVAELWMVRNRVYDPGAGRWLQRDPAGYVDGMSLYTYARGNPIAMLDPTGLGTIVGRWFGNLAEGASVIADVVSGRHATEVERSANGLASAAANNARLAKERGDSAGAAQIVSGSGAVEASATGAAVADHAGDVIQEVGTEGAVTVATAGTGAVFNGIRRGLQAADKGADVVKNLDRATDAVGAIDKTADTGKAQVQVNKSVGDAARDRIAAREGPGAQIERTYRVTGGSRRIDVVSNGKAIESKVGRTSLGKTERRQLARDVKLLRSGQVDDVVWEFSRSPKTGKVGPTGPLADKLDKLNISTKIER